VYRERLSPDMERLLAARHELAKSIVAVGHEIDRLKTLIALTPGDIADLKQIAGGRTAPAIDHLLERITPDATRAGIAIVKCQTGATALASTCSPTCYGSSTTPATG